MISISLKERRDILEEELEEMEQDVRLLNNDLDEIYEMIDQLEGE